MTHQEASAVLSVPVSEVEARLRDVQSWPDFLVGVEEVTASSFERFVFRVRDARQTREIAVAVLARPREHRVSWHALSRPAFGGEFRLQPVDERHTRVTLSLTAEPAGFLAGLGEMLGSSTSTATLDLQRLEALFGAAAGGQDPQTQAGG